MTTIPFQLSFFFVVFSLLAPVALIALARRTRGGRKLLWCLLAIPFSWLACVALIALVPRAADAPPGATRGQRGVALAALVALAIPVALATGAPRFTLAPEDLTGPGNAPLVSAYDVINNANFDRTLSALLKEDAGWRWPWHVFWTRLALLQRDRLSPVASVRFVDGSSITYHIARISGAGVRTSAREGHDAAGAAIFSAADRLKYQSRRGRITGNVAIVALARYLESLGYEVHNEVAGAAAARWHCAASELKCRIEPAVEDA